MPFGTVWINLPASFAPFLLRDVLGSLVTNNPCLRLDVVATDRLIDIVEEGFDARGRFGEVVSRDMVAVRIKPAQALAVVSSPDYLDRHPAPGPPGTSDTTSEAGTASPGGRIANWRFERNVEAIEVEVNGPLTLDHQELTVEAAQNGAGLAYVWEDRARLYLDADTLRRCLENWCPVRDDLFLCYPSRRYVSGGLRVLIDRLKA